MAYRLLGQHQSEVTCALICNASGQAPCVWRPLMWSERHGLYEQASSAVQTFYTDDDMIPKLQRLYIFMYAVYR